MLEPATKMFFSPSIHRAVRIALGLVFVWAGAVKLVDPRAFARVLSGYQMIPESLLAPIAIGLPLVEFLVGTGLVFNVRGSLSVVFGLLLMFLVVLGFAMYNNLDVDCGCFSPEEIHVRNSLRTAFFRDVGLMGGAVYLFFWRRSRARAAGGCESIGLEH